MRNIWTSAFDYQWNVLAGRDDRSYQSQLARERLARVKLSQKFQSYFLGAIGRVGAGAINEVVVSATKPLTFPAIVIDSWFLGPNFTEINIARTNPSRTQISVFPLTLASLISARFIQSRWLNPLTLAINELLQCRYTLQQVTTANSEIANVFRVIGLNRQPCPALHWQEIEDYIAATPDQFPIYLPCYSPDGRTIEFAGIGAAQRTTIVTREVDQPCLITGIGYNGVEHSSATAMQKIKVYSSSGHSFTPEPIPFPGNFQFTDYSESGPGGGAHRYFEFPIPYYLPRGGTMSCVLNDATVTVNNDNQAELVFRGVTI